MTRLADVSGLTPFGVPVFQAVRPLARSLSVSQGKGLTRQAAQVSALLEAAELAVAEGLPAPLGAPRPLAAMGADALDAWAGAPRRAHAIRLDLTRPRGWLRGVCLLSGRDVAVPWDLLSLDYTVPAPPDAHASSSGLATGNTLAEAAVGAVGELLERDLTAAFDEAGPRARRGGQIDPDSVDDPALRPLFARIAREGYSVRLWSMGDAAGLAAIRCAILGTGERPVLPPTLGSGCHPSRRIATLRAVLEAVQVHATLVAGARDDLHPAHYADPAGQRRELLFDTLALVRADRPWSSIPDVPPGAPERSLEQLLAAAARRSSLPVVGLEHASLVPGLHVFRALAPGLTDPARTPPAGSLALHLPPVRVSARRPVLFVGPTLLPSDVPAAIEARPPAVAGDLAALLADPPPAVGLVDGCFETGPSVWHKEILHLIAAGVPVLGAASLGALRAAELAALGMTGIGCVYVAYRDGRVRRDDAVMVAHAPAELNHRPLGVSLVDAEATLAGIAMAGADRRRLLRIVRRLHYAERSWERVLARFEAETRRPAPVTCAALAMLPSLKRADALALVAALERFSIDSLSIPVSVKPVEARFISQPDEEQFFDKFRANGSGTGESPPMPPLTSVYGRLLVRVIPALA